MSSPSENNKSDVKSNDTCGSSPSSNRRSSRLIKDPLKIVENNSFSIHKRQRRRTAKHKINESLYVEKKENEKSNSSNEEPVAKRLKLDSKYEETIKEKKSVKKKSNAHSGKVDSCSICLQRLSDTDLQLYQGHPSEAVEEFIALTDAKLNLFTGEEKKLDEADSFPLNKITSFTVYDENGHLCPFDSGLVERNVQLYFSGYIKPVYDEDSSPKGGVPARDVGPINEWWTSGFDGGEKALVGFTTSYGEYYLMEPSPEYSPFMKSVKEKIYLAKIVIEFLLSEENPSFEDLINKIQTTVPPPSISKINEESLLKHAQFVCDQVVSYDNASDSDEISLITSPCMRSLVNLAGVNFAKRLTMRKTEKRYIKLAKPFWTKATTTPLVKEVFETLFTGQIATTDELALKRNRCGTCETCQFPDCGVCAACKSSTEYSGNLRSKQFCLKRKCPNVAVQEAEDSEPDDEDSYQNAAEEINKTESIIDRSPTVGVKKKVAWIGKSVVDDGRRKYFSSAKVGDTVVNTKDFVSVEPASPLSPLLIGKIEFMWENTFNQKFMHIRWFCRGSETALGETADPQELFVTEECENSLLSGICHVLKVEKREISPNWSKEGGQPCNDQNETDKNSFYYQKRYDSVYGRFEDLLPDIPCPNPLPIHKYCVSCEWQYRKQDFEIPYVSEKLDDNRSKRKTKYGVIHWKGEEFRPGTCVFLHPTSFHFMTIGKIFKGFKFTREKKVDEDLYPEAYRKISDISKISSVPTPNPFCIGLIKEIFTNTKEAFVVPSDINITVYKFYRPENTLNILDKSLLHHMDLNKLYASNEVVLLPFAEVTGKCTVFFSGNIRSDPITWAKEGPYRFYFSELYDCKTQSTTAPPRIFKELGNLRKGKGKRKEADSWPSISEPLNCLDVFAGCGGLSEGLHQSGVAITKWAIEKEEPAANAFKLNNPKCTVFNEDCNVLLRMVMDGVLKTEKGQKLPQKGDVELLCGGPPCQGFSGMNRFNSRQYSLFKNSLIVSYLSYCDYYRPRFFILENVRNFVSFKRSMVLKLTLRCLLKMGYQITFGTLQAGHYGIPQTRRRAIIMAAAPGEILPKYPEPLHVFSPRAASLTVMIDDKKFEPNLKWLDSAPYRTITVRDAMSDLPEIPNGCKTEEMAYTVEPLTYFQKLMRCEDTILRDHICKMMGPLIEARIAHIPTTFGSDWRDLPNIIVKLRDDTYTKKLVYTHHDKKNGKSKTGALRGVCSCATGKDCNPMDRQFNTLIPWCLPHTGNRYNNWAGLYGRLAWDSFFSTTVTNPEPMAKQGRVLHPEQTRVVSVRECARSQGFPDKYKFYGSILDKHRQVGNAVPPPLGAALGREIRKSISAKERSGKCEKMIID